MAAPAPEANGYNVQLLFEGVPAGTQTLIGSPATLVVRRVEQRTDQCTSGSCDPMMETPITLVSAKCDDLCTVTGASTNGNVTLQAIATNAGSTTLHVRVRSLLDGAEWEDGYPLAFRAPPSRLVTAPYATVDKLPDEK